jgi:hypothetical protein
MNIESIISILGLLGIGGVIGGYFQYSLKQKGEIELKIQGLNENKYRSMLVYMRCLLKPENISQFNIDDPNISKVKSENVGKYLAEKLVEYYYNSILYASDEVLVSLKQFIDKPTESSFIETAMAMRRDLWKKQTKLHLKDLLFR